METKAFSFDLPPRLVAQHPADRREQARLLLLDRRSGALSDRTVAELPKLLPSPCVLVLNDSKVRKARLYARPPAESFGTGADRGGEGESGGIEFLLLACDEARIRWTAVTRGARKRKPGQRLLFPGELIAQVIGPGPGAGEVDLRFERPLAEAYFAAYGHVPLPPYIRRDDEAEDEKRYQTVYARAPGSVAAPTAGLHFTQGLLSELRATGVETVAVTLHVGMGTFAPVRSAIAEQHQMHEERYEVSPQAAETVNAAKRAGVPVVAVGTTSVRTLESAWHEDRLVAGAGSTRMFILPGYSFRVVDELFTNFHTPESTLLMLVAAFAGLDTIKRAYTHAVKQEYRFFSYGDAMLIR